MSLSHWTEGDFIALINEFTSKSPPMVTFKSETPAIFKNIPKLREMLKDVDECVEANNRPYHEQCLFAAFATLMGSEEICDEVVEIYLDIPDISEDEADMLSQMFLLCKNLRKLGIFWLKGCDEELLELLVSSLKDCKELKEVAITVNGENLGDLAISILYSACYDVPNKVLYVNDKPISGDLPQWKDDDLKDLVNVLINELPPVITFRDATPTLLTDMELLRKALAKLEPCRIAEERPFHEGCLFVILAELFQNPEINKEISEIDLSIDQMQPEDADAIANSIPKCTKLESFIFNWDEDCKEDMLRKIINVIKQCPTLRKITISVSGEELNDSTKTFLKETCTHLSNQIIFVNGEEVITK